MFRWKYICVFSLIYFIFFFFLYIGSGIFAARAYAFPAAFIITFIYYLYKNRN